MKLTALAGLFHVSNVNILPAQYLCKFYTVFANHKISANIGQDHLLLPGNNVYRCIYSDKMAKYIEKYFLKRISEMFFCDLQSLFLVLHSKDAANGQICARMMKRGSESVSHIIFYCQSSFLPNTFIRYMNVTDMKVLFFLNIINFLIHM